MHSLRNSPTPSRSPASFSRGRGSKHRMPIYRNSFLKVLEQDALPLVFGVLTAMRGVAIVWSGLVSSGSPDQSVRVTHGFEVGKWSNGLYFVGVMMLVASLGVVENLVEATNKAGDSKDEMKKMEANWAAGRVSDPTSRQGFGLAISMDEEPLSERAVKSLGKVDDMSGRKSVVNEREVNP